MLHEIIFLTVPAKPVPAKAGSADRNDKVKVIEDGKR